MFSALRWRWFSIAVRSDWHTVVGLYEMCCIGGGLNRITLLYYFYKHSINRIYQQMSHSYGSNHNRILTTYPRTYEDEVKTNSSASI